MFFIKVIAAALLIQTKPLIIERKTKKEQKTKQNVHLQVPGIKLQSDLFQFRDLG